PASVGDFVWVDKNGSGVQDSGEEGFHGEIVVLLDSAGNPIDLTSTSSAGKYGFGGLAPGSYAVRFTAVSGYVFTDQYVGGGGRPDDSDADPATGRTPWVVVTSGQVVEDLDAGLYQAASVSGRLWEDWNGNGVWDWGEVGRGGQTVSLLDAN